ncbi:hypothetical protein ROA7023_00739 [Roseisalinus antarcticus]|uniref:Uncharacterized protein n=1 Tax=Roseisalinus antarcticus TaxID=254357 RepID=A0A1Y5RRZ7_9RHOB|nr:hypothetical protein ROA7023_00739 [Roseisalinus antarcticus]
MTQYLGSWTSLPELTQGQAVPHSGTLRIEAVEDGVRIREDWIRAGQQMSTDFTAPADGDRVDAAFPGVDTFSMLHEDDRTLFLARPGPAAPGSHWRCAGSARTTTFCRSTRTWSFPMGAVCGTSGSAGVPMTERLAPRTAAPGRGIP